MKETSKVHGSLVFLAVLVIGTAMLSGTAAHAQQLTGTITGTAYDQAGGVIPNAQVEVVNEASGDIRHTVTNSSGLFTVTALQAGGYSVAITATGFTPWEQQHIVLNQGDTRMLPNIGLKVGAVQQQVEVVSASQSIAPLDTSEVSQTLDSKMVDQIQILGRDAGELIKVMPGMAYNNGLMAGSAFTDHTVSSNSGPVGSFSANGTQPYGAMSYMLDGANLVDPGNVGSQIANINSDMTAEVKVLMSSYDAEYAKGPVIFQAIGKSGAKDFHGEGYGYFRNAVLDSLDSTVKAQGGTRDNMPAEHYYYGGGNLGGPILLPFTKLNRNRNKLFFWAGYEYMDQAPVGSIDQYIVPTPNMLNGNFSAAELAPFQPLASGWTGATNVAGTCQSYQTCGQFGIVNGIIPQSEIDPNGKIMLGLLPKPNEDPATSGGYNYRFINPGAAGQFQVATNRWEQTEKVDYSISDNSKLTVSYVYQQESDLHPIATWWAPNTAVPYPSSMTANTPSQVVMGNFTHVFSPTMVNETVVTYARYGNELALANPSAVNPSALGLTTKGLFGVNEQQIPNTMSNGNALSEFMPQADFYGAGTGTFGAIKSDPAVYDNLTKVFKTHTFKFGFYWDQNQNAQSNLLANGQQGTYDFETYAPASTNNVIADELLGVTNSYGQANLDPTTVIRFHQISGYAQDQWKATRRLTLNLGIRFDHVGQYYDPSSPGFWVFNQAAYVNSPPTNPSAGCSPVCNTGLENHATNPSIPLSGLTSPFVYYLPRVGFAYDLFGNGKTVLRGGYAVFKYQSGINGPSLADSGTGSFSYASNPFVGLASTSSLSGLPTGAGSLNGGSITAMEMGDNQVPTTQDWNFTISQAAPWHSALEISYVGNRTTDGILLSNGGTSGLNNLNAIPLGTYFQPDPKTGQINCVQGVSCNANFVPNDYFPLANYQQVDLVSHGSYSNYNSFQVSWQKTAGNSFLLANYTFSKVLGIRDGYSGDGQGAGTIVDTLNYQDNYGTLPYDHTNILNLAYVYHLPSPVHGNELAKGLVNGWSISGVTQYQTGVPIQPLVGGNMNAVFPNNVTNSVYLGTDANVLVPLVTCNPTAGLKSGQYFNPNCFAPPAAGQQGTVVWPDIRTPASFNSDLSLFKDFHLSESRYVQFRVEAFNFLNHPNPEFTAGGQNNDLKLNFTVPGSSGNGWSATNTNPITTGTPLYTVGYRQVEFAVKFYF